MPDTLALTVSTGVSFGLLAGIVSGVCYLVANGLAWPRSREGARAAGRRLRGAGEGGGEECAECGREVGCDCSEPYRRAKFEEGRWFLKQVQKTLSYLPWSLSTDKLDSIGADRGGSGEGGEVGGGASVREFMEQLSARLAGGALDRTSVASLYDHPSYEGMWSRHRAALQDALVTLGLALRSALTNLPSGASVHARDDQPSASGAHARLKRLVRRVVEEAAALPALAHYARRARTDRDDAFESRTYEDLLATAILNKVIERYQAESAGGRSGGASSGIHSASASPTPSAPSSTSVSPPHSAHTPPPLHDDEDRSDSEWEREEAPPELPRRVPFPEFGGDIIHLSENMSEQYERDIEEVSGSDLQAADGSWEENWLFQRRKVKSLQSVPVPMLVPTAGSEVRAMIGDRDADDTTDLSDAASDSDEEYESDVRRALHSKTLIGGKNRTEQLLNIEATEEAGDKTSLLHHSALLDDKIVMKNELIKGNEDYDSNESHDLEVNGTEVQEVTADFNSSNSDSVMVVGVDSGPLPRAEFAVGEIHRTNGDAIEADGEDDVDGVVLSATKNIALNTENTNSLTNHQREGEYEEAIAVPVQRYADSLRRQHYTQPPAASALHNGKNAGIQSPENNSSNYYEDDLIPGSIADRERKKWLNYVEMPNNPYSAEAIQKRLSSKSTSAVFDFITTKPSNSEKVKGKEGSEEKVPESPRSSPSPKILKDVLAEEVPQYKRYGRDYYINEAKRSTGGRKKSNLSETGSLSSMNKSTSLDQFDMNEFTSPVQLIKQYNSMDMGKQSEAAKKPSHDSITISNNQNKENNITFIEYEDVNEQSLFSAKPIYLQDDTDDKFEDILRSATDKKELDESAHSEVDTTEKNSIQNHTHNNGMEESFLSSSSLDDSIKIYNVPKGEIVRDKEHLTGHESLLSVDKNDNIVTEDKNLVKAAVELHRSGKHDTFAVTANTMITNGSVNPKTIEDLQIMLPKVKDLAKKFLKPENDEEPQLAKNTPRRRKFSSDYELEVVNKNDQKLAGKNLAYMHSLTARSISKEFREELKLSMATPIKTPGGANELPEGIEEISKEDTSPGSPVPEPGTLKNKLAFFESLKF